MEDITEKEDPYYIKAVQVKKYTSNNSLSIPFITKFMREWDEAVERIKSHAK